MGGGGGGGVEKVTIPCALIEEFGVFDSLTVLDHVVFKIFCEQFEIYKLFGIQKRTITIMQLV